MRDVADEVVLHLRDFFLACDVVQYRHYTEDRLALLDARNNRIECMHLPAQRERKLPARPFDPASSAFSSASSLSAIDDVSDLLREVSSACHGHSEQSIALLKTQPILPEEDAHRVSLYFDDEGCLQDFNNGAAVTAL